MLRIIIPATIKQAASCTCEVTITRRSRDRSSVRDTFWPPSLIASIKCCCATFQAGNSPTTTSDTMPSATATATVCHSMLKSRYGGEPPSAAITVDVADANARLPAAPRAASGTISMTSWRTILDRRAPRPWYTEARARAPVGPRHHEVAEVRRRTIRTRPVRPPITRRRPYGESARWAA